MTKQRRVAAMQRLDVLAVQILETYFITDELPSINLWLSRTTCLAIVTTFARIEICYCYKE